jgi:hypothetical protein
MNDETKPADLQEVPGPLKVQADATPALDDKKAEAEAAAISSKTLEQEASANEHTRRERFRNNVAQGALCLVWVVIGLIAASCLALAWHYLMPEKWAWMSETQLGHVQTFVFSSAVVGALNAYARKYLN